MKIISGIYYIVNLLDGRFYIGSSKDILTPNKGRWYHHRNMLRKNKHTNNRLQRAWNRDSENNFLFVIAETCGESDLKTTEQKHLDEAKKKGSKIYNTSMLAYRIEMTESIRKKISDISKRNYAEGKWVHHMSGKHHSIETRQRISKSLKGRYSKELNPNYGKKATPDTLSKMSKNIKGKCTGSNNGRYNHTIYNFLNVYTRETFKGTIYNFIEKHNVKRAAVNDLRSGHTKKTINGWTLVKI
jgi:group I intron endonuclease